MGKSVQLNNEIISDDCDLYMNCIGERALIVTNKKKLFMQRE